MANMNKETKAVLGTAADKIGHYDEYAGGGDPLKKGEHFKVANTTEEAEKIREQNPNTKVRVKQPRNADGTFGYNSQNAKKLKYGPSRGTTVPDFLRGVDLLFLEKGTSLVMQGENGIEYYLSTINMTKEQLIENCKHYIDATQGFAGLHKGMMEKKKGRHSKTELDRAEQLKKEREEHDTKNKKYEGKKVSGIVPANSKPKLSPNTLIKMSLSEMDYDQLEKMLSGIDAGQLGRNTWGVRNYNKAGVSNGQLDSRKKWRDIKAQQVKANLATKKLMASLQKNSNATSPSTSNEKKELVGVGAGGPSKIEQKPVQPSNLPKPELGKKNTAASLLGGTDISKKFSYDDIVRDPKKFVQENAQLLKSIKTKFPEKTVKDIFNTIKEKGITNSDDLKKEFFK